MLYLRRIEHLARALQTTPKRLLELLDHADDCYRKFELIDPARPGKSRTVVDVSGPIRRLQERLLHGVLAPRLRTHPCSHGSVRGKNIKMNAEVHRRAKFVLKADISDFYPSVTHKRVYRLFHERFGCSPDVARLCTRLCTYDYHLAIGLVTSPALADQALQPIDRRITAACSKADLKYSRYVDDITISGPFDFGGSGFPTTVKKVLREHGFNANPDKWQCCSTDEGVTITGVRVRKSRLGLPEEFVASIEDQIGATEALIEGEVTGRPFFTRSQLMGRVAYARWIDPRRGNRLHKRVVALDWESAETNALRLGMATAVKRLVPCSTSVE